MFQKLTKIYHKIFLRKEANADADKKAKETSEKLNKDKPINNIINEPNKERKTQHISSKIKMQFLRLYSIAIADRDFDEKEKEFLIKFAKEKGVKEQQVKDILFQKINVKIPKEDDKKIAYLYDLAKMIWADKKVKDEEEKMFCYFAKNFNFLNEKELLDLMVEHVKKNTPLEKFKDSIKFTKTNTGIEFKEQRPAHSLAVILHKSGHAVIRYKERFDLELTQEKAQKAWDRGQDIMFTKNPKHKELLERKRKKYPNCIIKHYQVQRKTAFWIFEQHNANINPTLKTVYDK